MKTLVGLFLALGLCNAALAGQTCGLIPVDFEADTFQLPYDNNDHNVIVGGRLIGSPEDGQRDAVVWKDGTLIVLPGIGGQDEWAYSVNNRGRVVGYAEDQEHRSHAVTWNAGVTRKLRRLVSAPAGFTGKTGEALGVNDLGEIIGWSLASDGFRHAVLWSGGKIKDLNTVLGSSASTAMAINNKGQIVGSADYDDGNRVEAFLYESGTVQFVGSLGGDGAGAFDINDKGHVVGVSRTPAGRFHAFLWKNGVTRDLGTLGGLSSQALGINIHGQIVGISDIASGERRAFSWVNGVMTRIGTLPANDQGVSSNGSVARKINEKGWVAGYSTYPTTLGEYQTSRGWRWKRKC